MARLISMIVLTCTLASCTTYHGIEPLQPDTIDPQRARAVDSVTPLLKWKGVPGGHAYDIVIYRAIPIDDMLFTYAAGQEVYYVEGVVGTEHLVTESLDEDVTYLWSVRTRSTSGVGEWSTYDYTRVWPAGLFAKKQMFLFLTPKRNR